MSAYGNGKIEFHILKRKTKAGKTVYYAAFLSDEIGKNGKAKYRAVRSTGVGNLALANKIAREMLQDGRVMASHDDLEAYLLDFWDRGKSEYIRSQIAETGRTYSAAYLAAQISSIKLHFLPWCKENEITKLSDLTKKSLEAWRNYAYHDAGKTARVVNRTRQAVWTALGYAVDIGLLPSHPGGRVGKVKDKTPERQIFELEELKALFTVHWPDIRAYTAALLSVTTGMRLGEVRGLLIGNVHLEDNRIDVVTNYVDTEGLKAPKWDSERLGVPLAPSVSAALREIIRMNRWGGNPDDFVFFSVPRRDIPVSKDIITDGLKRASQAAKLRQGRTFHALRHTYVSHAASRLSPAALRRYVGHSSDDMTARYTHITDDDRKAIEALAGEFVN